MAAAKVTVSKAVELVSGYSLKDLQEIGFFFSETTVDDGVDEQGQPKTKTVDTAVMRVGFGNDVWGRVDLTTLTKAKQGSVETLLKELVALAAANLD